MNLIHFLTWRKTRTKNLKTTEFLELCGRVLSLIFNRYVSDSIWTIVKISWRGIHAKSFRVSQSSVDTRLVDFLENRSAFLLLLIEICANFLVFLVEQGRPLSVVLPFTVTNLFGFPSLISLPLLIAVLQRQILSLYEASMPCFGPAKLSSLCSRVHDHTSVSVSLLS